MSRTSAQGGEPTTYDGHVETAGVTVTEELIAELVGVGGYTHRLFNPTRIEIAAGARRPLPGPGILLLAGGLVEQCGVLDDAVALLEMRAVRFRAMVHAGQTLRVRVSPGAHRATSSPRIVQEFDWTILDETGETVAEAAVVMLMNRRVEGRPQ